MPLPYIAVLALLGSHDRALDVRAAAPFDASHTAPAIRFIDATADLGLDGIDATRVCFADLNADGRPDAIIRTSEKHRVFLHTLDAGKPRGFIFIEVAAESNLPRPAAGDCLVFADIDNDSIADAILTRSLDVNSEKFTPPEEHPKETTWLKGHANGTFGLMYPIGAKKATTSAIAVGDIDRDGRLDLFLGNWYSAYGKNNAAFTSDVFIQSHDREQAGIFKRTKLPEDDAGFTEEKDDAGRPTYGVLIADLFFDPAQFAKGNTRPQLFELNYGRRANRVWADVPNPDGVTREWRDQAGLWKLDGDDVRHGKYPEWLKERAKADPRFDRADELPYRSHGNTFDASIGDVDNDGLFDIALAEITHAWAGESSDRSRILFQTPEGFAHADRFLVKPFASLDRIPKPPTPTPPDYRPNWNQGDLFVELADLDHDGRLDLILSSGDYPDPAPHDNRLRLFHQQPDGSFNDITPDSGIDHVGSQQISLADVDADGDLDLIVGQSYNRFSPDLVTATNARQRSTGPRARLFLNQASDTRPDSSITISIYGNPLQRIAYDALGAIVRLTTTNPDGSTQIQFRQLIGIGGHAGKQHQFLVHFGLAGAARADSIEVRWPTADPLTTTIIDPTQLKPDHYIIRATRQVP